MSNSLKNQAKYAKILNVITVTNFVLLGAMLLFCYWNISCDKLGVCFECMSGVMASSRMIGGLVINIIQVVLVLIMLNSIKDFKEYEGNIALPILSGVTSILSAIHIILFWGLKAITHKENAGIHILDIQFTSARIVSGVIIFLNIILLIIVKLWYMAHKNANNM